MTGCWGTRSFFCKSSTNPFKGHWWIGSLFQIPNRNQQQGIQRLSAVFDPSVHWTASRLLTNATRQRPAVARRHHASRCPLALLGLGGEEEELIIHSCFFVFCIVWFNWSRIIILFCKIEVTSCVVHPLFVIICEIVAFCHDLYGHSMWIRCDLFHKPIFVLHSLLL